MLLPSSIHPALCSTLPCELPHAYVLVQVPQASSTSSWVYSANSHHPSSEERIVDGYAKLTEAAGLRFVRVWDLREMGAIELALAG